MNERILSFEAALAEVLAHAGALTAATPVQSVPLLDAAGCVLASPLRADRDQPPFDRGTRDGFALRSADLAADDLSLRVIGSLRAGELWRNKPLAPGEAIEIMTGAPLPAGADAVVMVEHTHLVDDRLEIEKDRRLIPGENVVPRAAEARAGDQLLPAGRVLRAAEIAVAASSGCAHVEVFAKPTVAIVATGDELVELAELNRPPEPWQIRNSNSYALAALVRGEGGHPRRLAIARDTLDDLRERIAEARAADLMLLSGGVSMGKYDLVEQVLSELGAEFFFTGALIQPGKPVVFGRLPKQPGSLAAIPSTEPSRQQNPWTYFFGLPGNPVSTQVCFHLFVAPLLRALGGRTEVAPTFVEARLVEAAKGGARVTRFLPAELTSAWDSVTVRVVGWQGSGDIAANARGNSYAVLPAGVEAFRAGETVRVLLR
jgi:molybdopterin molybdotransferase